MQIFNKTVNSPPVCKQFSGNSRSELTNIDGKACNNIPEAVNKLALSARLGHSCETGWNKHDSCYYSKQNSKFYYRVKCLLYYLQVYAKCFYLTLYTFSFEINESRLSDTRCCITTITSVVIKEWRDVTRDVLCRTTLTWRHTIGMWDKTQ